MQFLAHVERDSPVHRKWKSQNIKDAILAGVRFVLGDDGIYRTTGVLADDEVIRLERLGSVTLEAAAIKTLPLPPATAAEQPAEK